jgi:hypothetical protein
VPFYSEVSEKKLPTVETDDMLKEGLEIQNMMFYLRLKHFRDVTIDKTAWLPDISDPRLVASLLPLLALAKFEPSIKESIAQTVKDVERMKVEQKANSEDGTIVNALWDKGLFGLHSEIPNNEAYYFQTPISEDDKENVIPLTVSAFADEFKSQARHIRKLLNSLNLCNPGLPRIVKVAAKNYRVIFFSPAKFEKRLREFVIDYKPYALYEKLGLQTPKPTALATQATLPQLDKLGNLGADKTAEGRSNE